MEYVVKNRKAIPFPWGFEIEMNQKWRFLRVTRWVWERFEMWKTMNSHKNSREKLKCFKKNAQFAQNTRFSRLSQVACQSPGPAARTVERKLVKNFLSVFRDWKVYLRDSREVSRKNLCVPLATGPSTREHVANLSCESMKNKILKNIPSLFHDWSIYPPMSR